MKNGYLGLEISSSKLRYVYITRQHKRHTIVKAGTSAFQLDVSAPGRLAGVIREILTKEEMAPEQIFLTVSRKETLIRQTVLPKMSSQELSAVIPSEIEKIPVFTNKKFDFIFQTYPAKNEKLRVIFAAVEQGILNYLLEEIEQLKIDFHHVEIAPLNLKELVYLKEPVYKPQAMMVVHDRMSHFIIYQDHQYKLFYQTAIGLENLYPNGAKNLDEGVLTSLIGEVQRVIKSFVSENKEELIERIGLVWDKTDVANLDSILQKRLEAKVESFDLGQIPQLSIKEGEPFLNPVYMLAATPVVYHLTKLRPQFSLGQFFKGFHIKRYCLRVAAVSAIFIGVVGLFLGILSLNFYRERVVLSKNVRQITQQISDLKNDSVELYRKRDEYLQTRQGLLDQASYVQALNRISWEQVLSVVAKEIPEDLSLTSFSFEKSGSVTFVGDAIEVESIAEMIRRVDSSTILNNGRFDFLREKDRDNKKIFQFGIMAQLKENE
ncbi:MAG TPA: hypothetical protein DD723_03170 [Candidatus Omnitrophica bacterium]|nr:MAG: hypothetical protein A2Z81_01105 [Omnitrophica WOR_2 bacterium GWA2_45_18]OGX19257.1 MAG: hypothetical protein A2Y04_00220 [Omnitrophica WOR_2 bacterium GWC2_45_7]HBR14530.1 hypothetical protein [Candidatus Omnitrophota bacterium]